MKNLIISGLIGKLLFNLYMNLYITSSNFIHHYIIYDYDTHYSKFKDYLAVNRWVYDKDRGISIKTKNPQRAKDKAILPKPQLEINGIAHGARVTDGNLMRSTRLLSKQFHDVHDTLDVSSDEDVEANKKQPPPPKRRKKQQIPAVIQKWTSKLHNSLCASVRKHKGMAGNGGIAWTAVSIDLKMSKKVVQAEWKKIGKKFDNHGASDKSAVSDTDCADSRQQPSGPSQSLEDQIKALVDVVKAQAATMAGLAAEVAKNKKEFHRERDWEEKEAPKIERNDISSDKKQKKVLKKRDRQQVVVDVSSSDANSEVESHSSDNNEVVTVVKNKSKSRRAKKCKSKKAKRIPEGSKVMSVNDLELYQAALLNVQEISALKQSNLNLMTMRK